jgi:hypothetical protein
MSDCQRVTSWVESWTNWGVSYMCATMSLGCLWYAGVEHRYGARRWKWRSYDFVVMDPEWWMTSAETWPRDQCHRVTSCGGWHLGHALAWGRGRASLVASAVEDWGDTCLGRGGRAHGALLAVVWWLILEKLPSATDDGFRPSLASKLSGNSGGNQRRHVASSRRVCQDEATSCIVHGRQIKIPGFCPFRPG